MNDTIKMLLIYSISIYLPLQLLLLLTNKVSKANYKFPLSSIFVLTSAFLIALTHTYIQNVPASYIASFIVIIFLFTINLKQSIIQSYFSSCFYVFHAIVLEGVALGSLSLLLKKNSFMVLMNADLSIITFLISQILLLLLFFIYNKYINIQKLRSFFDCKKQLTHVLICHLVLAIFILFNSFTFYYNLDLVWISIAQILVGLIIYIVFIIIMSYGINTADLLQHKIRDQNQLETIKQQMRAQNSLIKITETLNLFKHDYREDMLLIEYYIEHDKKEEALLELKKDHIELLNALPQVKKFSNNLILNSLFIDCQSTCSELDITMEALLYIPLDLSISEKECHEIFRILIENALDANTKVQKSERYIKVTSDIEKQWLSVVIENPYEGVVYFEDGRPISEKQTEDNKGLGLIYIESILDAHLGMIRYETNTERKIFKAVVLIRIEHN